MQNKRAAKECAHKYISYGSLRLRPEPGLRQEWRVGMARRKRVAYRKRVQNRFSMFLVTLVVVLILILVQMGSLQLQRKIDAKAAEAASLQTQIDAELEREQEIANFGKEVQTKGYIENVAREKLGLVYEDEILFKQKD